ncbi:MAG: hypothetical protein AMJ75_00965 [Phycisphaerae bacterium SM1_79]|nr:MAG: hypothetical protein AMJ75_00965 [Phycisphaerae bacterium SM1_79]
MFTKRCLFSALLIGLLCALTVRAEKVATVSNAWLVRMEYPSGEYIEATLDYRVRSIDPNWPWNDPNELRLTYVNAVADLNPYSEPSDGREWIVQNVPIWVAPCIVGHTFSVWFDPTVHNLPDQWIGEHDVWSGFWYDISILISDTEIADPCTDPNYGPAWDTIATPAGFWALLGGPGQSNEEPPTETEPAKAAGDTASPVRTDMPDITQEPNECGPTSAANSLRWLAKKHNFSDKLPKKDDDLIKDLMKTMTGSNQRPFHGLRDDQLHDGKISYAKQKKLPIIVKGGMKDPNAYGAKAFDFIKREFDAGEDVEFLIKWPGVGRGSHWVTVAGYAIKGNRLFLNVNDPDDGKTGTVVWELDRNGVFKTRKGKMLWAVSESFVKQDDIAVPDASAPGHHNYSGHMEQNPDGSWTYVEDSSSHSEHSYDPATHMVHLKNEEKKREVKIIKMTATFHVPPKDDPFDLRFDPRATDDWAKVNTTSQIIQRNKNYVFAGGAGRLLEIEQKWKLVPNPASEDIDLSNFFVGSYPLQLSGLSFDTWCMKAKVKVEHTDGDTKVKEDGTTSDEIIISLVQPPLSDVTVLGALKPEPQFKVDANGTTIAVYFDLTNWDIPQKITVTAADDAKVEGDHTGHLELKVTSDDPAFQGNYLPPVPVLIQDDECGPRGYLPADLNRDCCVDWRDFVIFADEWLACTTCPTSTIVITPGPDVTVE